MRHTTAVFTCNILWLKGPSNVTVYRVEGTPNTRIVIECNGKVRINGSTTLYLNFGNKARVLESFEKRGAKNMDGVTIKKI